MTYLTVLQARYLQFRQFASAMRWVVLHFSRHLSLPVLAPAFQRRCSPLNTHHHIFRPVDALLRTDTGSWCVRRARPLLLPLIVMVAPLQASLLVAFSALKVAVKGVLMGTQAVYQESVVNN